jgi:hypothetical protein
MAMKPRVETQADLFCRSLFQRAGVSAPDPLKRNDLPFLDNEVREAGFEVKPGWKPDRLNETYLFVVLQTGKIWVTPQLISPRQNDAYIGSHRALEARKNKKNPQDKIVAAGEIIVKNGVISFISNKSGTFRGNQKHLDYSIFMMRNLGIEIPEQVNTQDFFSEPRDLHAVHLARAEALSLAETPEYKDMKARWEPLIFRLHQLYPDRRVPGELSGLFVDDVWTFIEANGKEYRKTLGRLAGYTVYYSESADHLVRHSLKDPETAHSVQRDLEKFIESRESQLGQSSQPTH